MPGNQKCTLCNDFMTGAILKGHDLKTAQQGFLDLGQIIAKFSLTFCVRAGKNPIGTCSPWFNS